MWCGKDGSCGVEHGLHSIQFGTHSNMFCEFAFSLNAEQDRAFSSGPRPNFELNFGSVQIGSGLNLSSEPNFYNPTCNHSAAHDLAVAEERVDANCALPHVDKTLHYPHHEAAVSFFVIVIFQLPKHLCQPCVVGSSTNEAMAKIALSVTCKSLSWLCFESVSRMLS